MSAGAKLSAALAVLASSLPTLPALAQVGGIEDGLARLRGTLSVELQPVMSDGTLSGCTVVFEAIHQDWAYRQGAFIRVDGNFGLMSMHGSMGAVLKVVVHDISPATFSIVPAGHPPTRAYLIGDDYQTNIASRVGTSSSNTPGALFSVFHLIPSLEMMLKGIEKGEIKIAFNVGEGSTDIILPIDLAVVSVDATGTRTRSMGVAGEFLNCARALASLKE